MANIPYTGDTGSTSYSLKSGCESVTVGARSEATWITITSVGNGSINYNVSANAGSERTGYITPTVNGVSCSSNKFSVTQDGVPTPSCTCSDFSITPTSLSWDSGSTSSKDITITSGTCISNITVNTLTHFNATVGSGKITVSPKGTNTTTSPYVETLTISYKANGNTCTPGKTVSLTQSGQVPVTCTCSDLTASAGGIITATGGTSIQIGTVSYTCVKNVTAISSSESWADNLQMSGKNVTANISSNTDTANTRTAYITISGATDTKTCTTGFTITQSKSATTPTCECTALTVQSTATVTAGTSIEIPYTANCVSVGEITASSEKIIIDTSTSGKIKVTGNTKGSATITIKSSVNGTPCPDRKITVTINCPTITISPDSGSTSCDGGSVTFTAS